MHARPVSSLSSALGDISRLSALLLMKRKALRMKHRAKEWEVWEAEEKEPFWRGGRRRSRRYGPTFHCDHKYDPEKWRKSAWYDLYVRRAPKNKKELDHFRCMFRIPRASFTALIARMRRDNWFPTVGKPNALGQDGVPLELLVLASLRALGRGLFFADVAESSGVAKETCRRFFHDFVAACKQHLYPEWVMLFMICIHIPCANYNCVVKH